MNTPVNKDLETKIVVETYVVKDGEVLLFKRPDNDSFAPGQWVAPGGKVDVGEDYMIAAQREVLEEVGVDVPMEKIRLKAIALHTRGKKLYNIAIFVASIDSDAELKISEGEGEAAWVKLDELKSMHNLLQSIRYYIDHIFVEGSGILYTNIDWDGDEIVAENSRTVDLDY